MQRCDEAFANARSTGFLFASQFAVNRRETNFDDTEIPAATCGDRHARRDILTRMDAEFEARRARLCDLEQHIAPAELIADRDVVLIGAFEREILAEGVRRTGKLVRVLPPLPVIGR